MKHKVNLVHYRTATVIAQGASISGLADKLEVDGVEYEVASTTDVIAHNEHQMNRPSVTNVRVEPVGGSS